MYLPCVCFERHSPDKWVCVRGRCFCLTVTVCHIHHPVLWYCMCEVDDIPLTLLSLYIIHIVLQGISFLPFTFLLWHLYFICFLSLWRCLTTYSCVSASEKCIFWIIDPTPSFCVLYPLLPDADYIFPPQRSCCMSSLIKVREDISCKDLTTVYSANHLLMCNGPVHILLHLMLTDGCHVDQCPSHGHQALPSRSPTQTCQPIRRAQRVAHRIVQYTDGI